MKRLLVSGMIVAAASVGAVPLAGGASAAPITCPDSQVAVKTAPGEWECQNNGGNYSNAEDTRNPNTKKWGDTP